MEKEMQFLHFVGDGVRWRSFLLGNHPSQELGKQQREAKKKHGCGIKISNQKGVESWDLIRSFTVLFKQANRPNHSTSIVSRASCACVMCFPWKFLVVFGWEEDFLIREQKRNFFCFSMQYLDCSLYLVKKVKKIWFFPIKKILIRQM